MNNKQLKNNRRIDADFLLSETNQGAEDCKLPLSFNSQKYNALSHTKRISVTFEDICVLKKMIYSKYFVLLILI